MASSAMGGADDADANSLQLTSTTAPGKVFASRSELAAHYKSPWHKYNLKRRQAGLPVLLQVDFEARLQAAQALRKSSVAVGTGKGHLKDKKKKSKKKKQQQHAISDDEDNGDEARQAEPLTVELPASQQGDELEEKEGEEEMNIDINPRQCLFDRHISSSVSAAADRMQRKYGFFIPDREYLVDLEGLLGYCHEKIQLGHVCLYCQRVFSTASACQKHMLSYSKGARHCKLRYEEGVDLEEFDVFYDFSEANAEFLRTMQPDGNDDDEEENVMQEEENDNGDDGWEDVSDDDDEDAEDDENDDDDDDYDGYEEQVAGMGLDVTPLGELVFPDGRIIGHRSLKRYYKQRLSARRATAQQSAQSNVAVQAALEAAGERLYRGRVYNIHHAHDSSNNPAGHEQNALALSRAGLAPGMAAGRAGKGLLVKASGSSVYTQLSVYRYRAAVRKERRGKIAGERLQGKQLGKNMNRMDKRANRLMNNVSVAHAKR